MLELPRSLTSDRASACADRLRKRNGAAGRQVGAPGTAIMLLVALAACGSLPGVRAAAADPAELAEAITALDADQFRARSNATRRLAAAGMSAVEPLVAALPGLSREASARAFAILRDLAAADRPDAGIARKALDQLAAGSQPAVSRRAREALAELDRIEFVRVSSYFAVRGGQVTRSRDASVYVRISNNWTGNESDLRMLAKLEHVKTLSFQHAPITDRAIEYLKGLRQLETLYLSDTGVTGKGLGQLGELPKLRNLSLERLELSDETIGTLKRFPALEVLRLDGTGISNEAMRVVGRLENVTYLSLNDTHVGDEGLRHLRSLKRLQRLYLNDTPVTGSGFEEFKELQALNSLWIRNAKVGSEGAEHLAALPLTQLALDNNQLQDGDVEQLAKIKSLQSLYLSGNKITNKALPYFRNHPALRYVYVRQTKVTKEAAAAFEKKANNNCRIRL